MENDLGVRKKNLLQNGRYGNLNVDLGNRIARTDAGEKATV